MKTMVTLVLVGGATFRTLVNQDYETVKSTIDHAQTKGGTVRFEGNNGNIIYIPGSVIRSAVLRT